MKLNKIIFYSSILLINLWSFQSLSQDLDYVRRVIQRLCAPEMHGRGYVKEGEQKAAEFIQDEMINIGLEPLNGSYKQYFDIKVNTFPGRMLLKIDEESLIPGKDFIIHPGSPGIQGTYKIQYVNIHDFIGIEDLFTWLSEIRNKVVLMDYTKPERGSDSTVVDLNNFIEIFRKDTLLQIPALIVRNYPRMMWSVSTMEDRKPVIYISDRKEISVPDEVGLHIDQDLIDPYETQNVTGIIPGAVAPDSLLVFTAHYDHLGRMGLKTWFPGANDNASGVAMMLDLARHFTGGKSSPRYSILFVAFGAEEAGLLGSLHFVQDPPVDLKKVRFLINLDLAGTGDEGITAVNGSIFKDKFDLLKEINEKNGFLPQVKSRGEACNSDHCPFYMAGVPCFFIYTLGGIQAYHDIYDRYETLPLTGYQGYYKLLVEFVGLLF